MRDSKRKQHAEDAGKDRDTAAPEQEAGAAPQDAASGADAGANGPVAEAAPQEEAAPAREGGDGTAAPAALERELATTKDRHMRLAAEFDNYRKRVERERAETWNRAQAQLAEKLLDVLDDLQRVAHYNPETATAESLLEGAQMVERKLQRALESAGLEEIAAEGQPFDPQAHEALMTVPAETREEDDTVADVFQKGYRFKGTLLRPARVRVKNFEG